MFGVAQVDIADVVHDAAVDLLRHAHIEAAVAGFHMEDGDLAAFGRNHGQATVRVAQHQNRLGPLFLQHHIRLGDGIPDGLGGVASGGVEVVLGPLDAQFLEEDPIEL